MSEGYDLTIEIATLGGIKCACEFVINPANRARLEAITVNDARLRNHVSMQTASLVIGTDELRRIEAYATEQWLETGQCETQGYYRELNREARG